MKVLLSLAILFSIFCSKLESGEYFSVQKSWQGFDREYLVYLPKNYSINKEKLFPVMFGLQGYTGTASGFERETTRGMNLLADSEDLIIVYPQGSHFQSVFGNEASFVSSWNDVFSNAEQAEGKHKKCKFDRVQYPKPPECSDFGFCAWTSCYDDIGFLKSIIQDVSSNYRVDTKRRYMVGMSNGGAMAYRFSCLHPELLSASVTVASSIPLSNPCSKKADLPLLIIYGTSDATTPSDGSASWDGYFYEPASDTFHNWADNFNCGKKVTKLDTRFSEEKGLVCWKRSKCDSKRGEVQLCEITGGGHSWPGQEENVGFCRSSLQISTIKSFFSCKRHYKKLNWGNELIWDFLKQYERI